MHAAASDPACAAHGSLNMAAVPDGAKTAPVGGKELIKSVSSATQGGSVIDVLDHFFNV